jgi:hypothetical protein
MQFEGNAVSNSITAERLSASQDGFWSMELVIPIIYSETNAQTDVDLVLNLWQNMNNLLTE